jgi:hypothetical protein
MPIPVHSRLLKIFYIALVVKYNYDDEIKKDVMGMLHNTHGEKGNAYRILVGKQGGKRSLGRPRCR